MSPASAYHFITGLVKEVMAVSVACSFSQILSPVTVKSDAPALGNTVTVICFPVETSPPGPSQTPSPLTVTK
ncbi:hypothetical protein D3C72_418780 [compost metagenome]